MSSWTVDIALLSVLEARLLAFDSIVKSPVNDAKIVVRRNWSIIEKNRRRCLAKFKQAQLAPIMIRAGRFDEVTG